jgi:hypothetical protein
MPNLSLATRSGVIKSAFSHAIDLYRDSIPDAISAEYVLRDLEGRRYAWIDCIVALDDKGSPRWRQDFLDALGHRQACLAIVNSLQVDGGAPKEVRLAKQFDALVPFLQRHGYSSEEVVALWRGCLASVVS